MIKLKYHQRQIEALESKKRFVLMLTGVQGGKTTTGAIWEASQYARYPENNHAIIAPTYKILKQSTLPKFFELFPYYRKYYREKDSVIRLPNPKYGTIFVRSADKPQTLEGMTCRSIWGDEAGQFSRYAWIVLQGRVSFLQGQIFLTTRPYAMNWLKKEFYDIWEKAKRRRRKSNYDVIEFESKDNPAFPMGEYLRAKEEMDPRVFAMMYQGKFQRMVGLVYLDFDEKIHIVKKIPWNKVRMVLGGIDWGYTNPAAFIFDAITMEDKHYVFEEYYKTGQTIQQLIDKAKSYRNRFPALRMFIADPAEPDNIASFREQGISIIEGDREVVPGINKVRQLLRQKKLFIHESCKNLIDEFQTYQYEEVKEGKHYKEVPKKYNDHGLDALRYILKTATQARSSVVLPEEEIRRRKERLHIRDFINEPKTPHWLEL